MWIYLLRHGAGKGHGAGKEAWRWKKRAWRWEKGAWRGAMLKGAGGNTTPWSILPKVVNTGQYGWSGRLEFSSGCVFVKH